MRFSVFTSLDEVRDIWTALEARADASAFQRLDWAAAWAAQFCRPGAVEPRIAVGTLSGEPVILVPLVRDRRLGCGRLRWLGAPLADYNGVLADRAAASSLTPETFGAALIDLARGMGDADFFWLEKLPTALGTDVLAALPSRRHAWSAHALTLRSTWDETYRSIHSSTTRRRLASKERKVRALGDLAFELVSDRDIAEAVTGTLLNWKMRQLAARGDRNPFDAESLTFLKTVSTIPDLARVYRLTLDGTTIAACLTLVRDDRLYIYQMAFDPDAVPQASPGRLLLYKLLQDAVESGFGVVDFTIGDEDYKIDLCDSTAPMMRRWLAVTPRGQVACVVLNGAMLARDAASRNGALRSAIRKASTATRALGAALGARRLARISSASRADTRAAAGESHAA